MPDMNEQNNRLLMTRTWGANLVALGFILVKIKCPMLGICCELAATYIMFFGDVQEYDHRHEVQNQFVDVQNQFVDVQNKLVAVQNQLEAVKNKKK